MLLWAFRLEFWRSHHTAAARRYFRVEWETVFDITVWACRPSAPMLKGNLLSRATCGRTRRQDHRSFNDMSASSLTGCNVRPRTSPRRSALLLGHQVALCCGAPLSGRWFFNREGGGSCCRDTFLLCTRQCALCMSRSFPLFFRSLAKSSSSSSLA